jgi:transcriptional regulator with GAF, ATPase, and Fis domain
MPASNPPPDPSATREGAVPVPPGTAYWLLVSCDSGVSSVPLPLAGSIVLGRAPECDVLIEDDSVSRRHAVIDAGDPPSLADLESRNGTRIAGVRLAPDDRRPIPVGTVVELGSATLVVQRGAALANARARGAAMARESPPTGAIPGLVLEDPTMKRLHALIEMVAPTTIPVLVLGETGVGKESIAEAIHTRSTRAGKPLLRLNCAALPESILEGELFGYERGAFTGAVSAKAGLFESADGGTVFLDEVGDMPLVTQAKLLRVLEVGEVLRLGSVKPKTVDVRVVAATNRDLQAMIPAGAFRADLFFRLNGLSFTVPPLRDRPRDVGPLAKLFVARFCERNGRRAVSVTDDAVRALEARPWPGNVRELKAFVERATLLSPSAALDARAIAALDDPLLASSPSRPSGPPPAPAAPAGTALAGETESERITRVLTEFAGNQSRAAKALGISRRSFMKKLDKYGIVRPRKPRED